ncbi:MULTISPECIES: hypothetical protein [unclassified Pseudomonas]|uniref:hypothetical protein n=1 Tax=unclassified Pseudomonas TaxID=196821 RepID=UPI001CBBB182|nr:MULTISPECIES: hypothetical protein [unclassified Pseudomonas]
MSQFKDKIKATTGRAALPREISAFTEQVAVAAAHHQPGAVQFGLCDFQTLSGRAETIEVQLM